MSAGAWVMFVIGALLLWGGLALSLYNAAKVDKEKKQNA